MISSHIKPGSLEAKHDLISTYKVQLKKFSPDSQSVVDRLDYSYALGPSAEQVISSANVL